MSEVKKERDYRDTLRLPKTEFPMKAELPKREPERVAWWQIQRTYHRRLAANKRNGAWILHDGPPYANGELHMGHFLNMVLKDMFVKIALLDGAWAEFIPGWDMHGLPIELETLKHLGIRDFHAIDPLELRALCEERAVFWFERQRATRQRMGIFAEWDRPYRTIDKSFEAAIVDTLADLAQAGQLYNGLRSTLWCVRDETALAEAEIEYKPKVSESVYVRFSANDAQRSALLEAFRRGDLAQTATALSVIIWTTTPWTLPANVAIALRPETAYALARNSVTGELVIFAEAMKARVEAQFQHDHSAAALEQLATVLSSRLEGISVRHPLMDRNSLIVVADYVDLESGTGAVHTAPGHGADDFATGMKYGLPILNPVDAAGKFTTDAGPYAGQFIFKANAHIIEDLRQSGALISVEPYEHSYPHCWRCHQPVIFRATAQWFIGMDRNDLRARAIAAAGAVQFTPEWGRDRLVAMLEGHPEWCISRQRTWGTPIPALTCNGCNESILDPRVARAAAARFAEVGASAWWRDPVETYLPSGFTCPDCGNTHVKKEMNIVDIWFESGVTHRVALQGETPWPSDLVLEGGDQYRGWFRSSLLTAVATVGRAPYKRVVKNGWVNDEQGRPMSKSRGTGIDAGAAMEKWGADVLRLWAASVEFVDDVRFGPSVIEQVGRVYRNIRNRIRFMLANLDDLGAENVVAREEMMPLDALACSMVDLFVADLKALYDGFSIHDAYLRIVAFESSMSGLYFDALKDPLYSRAADDARRRSAQSALLSILTRFLTAVAPILSFTAEEAWQSIPAPLRREQASVFDSSFGVTAIKPEEAAEARALWELLRGLRARVSANVGARDFELKMTLRASGEAHDQLASLGDNLREAMVVSQLTLVREPGAARETRIQFDGADGEKCRRCWKFRKLGECADHPLLCAECAEIIRSLDG